MKPILLPTLILLTACQPLDLSKSQRAAIVGALSATTHAPDPSLITINTKFAAKCPYDGTLNLSKSTKPTGAVTSGTTNFQSWTIAWVCSSCQMPFNDSRVQILPPTKSVRLPSTP